MQKLANIISETVGYGGKITFDFSRPHGWIGFRGVQVRSVRAVLGASTGAPDSLLNDIDALRVCRAGSLIAMNEKLRQLLLVLVEHLAERLGFHHLGCAPRATDGEIIAYLVLTMTWSPTLVG